MILLQCMHYAQVVGPVDDQVYDAQLTHTHTHTHTHLCTYLHVHTHLEPLAVSASDVRIDVSLTSGISATINFSVS